MSPVKIASAIVPMAQRLLQTIWQPIKKLLLFFFSGVRLLYAMSLHTLRPDRNVQPAQHCLARVKRWMALLACISFSIAVTANHSEEKIFTFDIPSLAVQEALGRLAQQTGHPLLFSHELVELRYSSAVKGEYTVQAALAQLLKGTHLSGRLTERGVIIIADPNAKRKSLGENSGMNTRKKLLASTIAFFVGTGGASDVLGQDGVAGQGEKEGSRFLMEEVVVTANKREQGLQDIAMSITAIGAEEIERKSLVGMGDYLSFVPNVSLLEMGSGWSQIVIRGVGISLLEQSTVSSYLGEVPLTNSSRFGFSTDIKLVDIERIEVLRGPQGTLYGSGALGGTVRNIPQAVNLGEMEGKIDLGYSSTSGAEDDNNKLVGMVNLPLIEDKLGFRASLYRYDNAGYIDLVSTPEKEALALETGTSVAVSGDTGGHTYTGGRASVLWQASDDLSVALMYAKQEIEEDGLPDLNINLGGYQISHLALTGSAEKEFRDDDVDFF